MKQKLRHTGSLKVRNKTAKCQLSFLNIEGERNNEIQDEEFIDESAREVLGQLFCGLS